MLRSEHTYKDVLSTRLRALYDAAQQVRKLKARQQRAMPRRRSVGDAVAAVKGPRRNDIESCYALLDLQPLDEPAPLVFPVPTPGATQRLTGSLIASYTDSVTSSSPPPPTASSLAPPIAASLAETASIQSDEDTLVDQNEVQNANAPPGTLGTPTSATLVAPPAAANNSIYLATSALSDASVASTSSVWSEVYASYEPFYGTGQWTLTPDGRAAAAHTFAAGGSAGNRKRIGISFRSEFNVLKEEFLVQTATATGTATGNVSRRRPQLNENNRVRLPLKRTIELSARSAEAESQANDAKPPPTECALEFYIKLVL